MVSGRVVATTMSSPYLMSQRWPFSSMVSTSRSETTVSLAGSQLTIRFAHGEVRALVHREALALPVEREAHELLLLADAAAAALLPLPGAAHELLAPEIEAGLLLAALEILLDEHVDRDRRVVDARHPH